ncbi:DUF747-domain-containing protein [Aspergillus ellipticus CBS 707.79]|uniref:DUF747-domain-containing protein n=1 Tax=Aspergillus ellipticus CBS 707.79 TaxID=1448320 RepID=A0A319ERS4_9EURO|nr:DUF747-domain-containing protein [Aspergillus ellipticus CBS 707.79]
MALRPCRVLIAGAGVAGLALALMLEKHGIDCLVLEAYSDIVATVGAGICLVPNGLRILDQLGCYEDLLDRTKNPVDQLNFRKPDGEILWGMEGADKQVTEKYGYSMLWMDRKTVLEVLFDHIADKSKLLTGKRVVNVTHTDIGVDVATADGSTYSGDILVGTDGTHSTIRQEIARRAGELELGEDYMEEESFPRDTIDWVLNENFSYTYYGTDIPQFTREDMARVIQEHWNDPVTPDLRLSDLYGARMGAVYTPMREFVYKKWHLERMITVGDACHKVLPITAQGGNQALESVAAVVNGLMTALSQDAPGPLALSEIETMFEQAQETRSPRAARVVETTHHRQKMDMMETPELKHFALNEFAGKLPGAMFQRWTDTYTPGVSLTGLPIPVRPRSIPFDDEVAREVAIEEMARLIVIPVRAIIRPTPCPVPLPFFIHPAPTPMLFSDDALDIGAPLALPRNASRSPLPIMDDLNNRSDQRRRNTVGVAGSSRQEPPTSPRKTDHERGMDNGTQSSHAEKHRRSVSTRGHWDEGEGRAHGTAGHIVQRGGSIAPHAISADTHRGDEKGIARHDGAGVSDYPGQNGFPSQPRMGDQKGGQFSLPSDQALGLVFEHSLEGPEDAEHRTTSRTSLVEVLEGSEVASALHQWSRDTSPPRNQDKDQERVLKLSPAKMQELTSSPHSIPYRAAPEEPDRGRRAVSDASHAALPEANHSAAPSPGDPKITETIPRLRPKELSIDVSAVATAKPSASFARSRPPASRAVSTPNSRRQTMPANNDRLAQTWASRTKPERPSISRDSDTKHLSPSPQVGEPPLPSPMPPTIPLPPLSVPTYLQLELASGRPSPLYIHRSAMSDFPYESSRVKLERLMNFLMLPPKLERVLWFGTLACLDAWLHSFTILPLRFFKALYILLESWIINLGVESRFVSGFVIKGVGRVWRRRNRASSTDEGRSAEPGRTVSGKQENGSLERESRSRPAESRRRHRHRRQKSIPSALMPDDKADILKGLLIITTCSVLMYFDASRMYHWIRGQAAIKLYVIYNVLEVSDRLFAAIGQDVLECLFSREALERRPDGRSKVFRPFGLFLLALAYTVIHSTALFYQVMTLNVAVNSYSNALITLLLSNQFVEIKSTVFKKFEKENLFQLTCADVVERFQLWLMLTIIALRNLVETGAFNILGSLGSSLGGYTLTVTNSTPLSTPPRTSSSILPQAFTIVPSSIIASFSQVNTYLPTLAQVLGPFLVVLGSEMLVDWLKHAYIGKFNNTRPAIYGRFLDILTKDYYTNAFADQNLTRRLGLPVIPLSCLFFRVSIQTYQMFITALLPQHPSSTAVEATSLSAIHRQYVPAPLPSPPPLTLRTFIPTSTAYAGAFFRQLLANAMPSPAQSVYIFTIVLILTGFVVLLILKLLLGMVLLAYARSRYKAMKVREAEQNHPHASGGEANGTAPRGREFAVEDSRRVGGWGVVEVNEDHRRWIYADDPEGLRRLKAKEEKDKNTKEDPNMDHVQRYEMVAKRIW